MESQNHLMVFPLCLRGGGGGGSGHCKQAVSRQKVLKHDYELCASFLTIEMWFQAVQHFPYILDLYLGGGLTQQSCYIIPICMVCMVCSVVMAIAEQLTLQFNKLTSLPVDPLHHLLG